MTFSVSDAAPPLQSRTFPLRVAHLGDFIALMKPRVMSLVVFTALVGELLAPGHLDPLMSALSILSIALGAGAAAVFNMWYDADIDAVMRRTASRPIPSGQVTRTAALAFGLVSAVLSVALLGMFTNLLAAALLAFTIFFYAVVYTMWLKRRTPQNIVIGGAAGALPPVIGWAAVTGNLAVEPILLSLIIFFWTPPHFWALAIGRCEEYARANIPMLPVVAGEPFTKRQILIYSVALLATSLLPWIFGFAGARYGIAASALGAMLIVLAVRLLKSQGNDHAPAYRLFGFSIIYLFALYSALLMDALSRGTIESLS